MVLCRTEGSATARKPNNTTVLKQREIYVYNLRINGAGVAHADTLGNILDILEGYKHLGFIRRDTSVQILRLGSGSISLDRLAAGYKAAGVAHAEGREHDPHGIGAGFGI